MHHRTRILIVCVLASLFICGCTSQNSGNVAEKQTTLQTTPGQEAPEHKSSEGEKNSDQTDPYMSDSMNGTQSGSLETMALNDTRSIYLKENPTTGYVWNATVSSGLIVDEDSYVADPVKPGIVGSGGMHFWLIRGVEKGNQTFDAVYKRPWEPASVNDTRYVLNLIVE